MPINWREVRGWVGLILFVFTLGMLLYSSWRADEKRLELLKLMQVNMETLASRQSELSTQLDGVQQQIQRQSWAWSSRAGKCHPDILRMVDQAWANSLQQIPIGTLRRVVWAESRCLPWAVSHRGAHGLMQLRDQAAAAIGYAVEAMDDPVTNLEAGIAYLELMLKLSAGDLSEALTRYNWGPDRFLKGVTTREYARAVMD